MALVTLPKLVTKADAAEIFGVCVKTVDNYIARGLLPQPVPFCSKEYWHPDVFRGFLDRTFKSAPQADVVAATHESMAVQGTTADAPGRARGGRIRDGESAASFRQRMRQEAALRACNAGGEM